MNTITARTINEVFIHNLIKVSISLHAGTSSFTYAYGTPNHLTQLYPQFKIPFKNGNGNSNEFTRNIINGYYNGDVDNLPFNESSESPDNYALEGILLYKKSWQHLLCTFQINSKTFNIQLEK